jgi:hypothetical protein
MIQSKYHYIIIKYIFIVKLFRDINVDIIFYKLNYTEKLWRA